MFSVDKTYLNPTLACHTKANKKNNTGIIGKISARGPNTAKTPGNLLIKIVSIKSSVSLLIMIKIYYTYICF